MAILPYVNAAWTACYRYSSGVSAYWDGVRYWYGNSCLSSSYKKEYYCSGNTPFYRYPYCSYGCSTGSCNPPPCSPSCTGDRCGQSDGCGGTCSNADASSCGKCGNAACCSPVNGGWSSSWTTCSATCGGGTQTRTCNNPSPSCGGSECSCLTGATCSGSGGSKTAMRDCNTQSCCSDDGSTCNYDNSCDTTGTNNCGTQVSRCDRTTRANGGWSGWTICSATCGGGTQTATCNNPPPLCGGSECSCPSGATCTGTGGSKVASKSCNTQACIASCGNNICEANLGETITNCGVDCNVECESDVECEGHAGPCTMTSCVTNKCEFFEDTICSSCSNVIYGAWGDFGCLLSGLWNCNRFGNPSIVDSCDATEACCTEGQSSCKSNDDCGICTGDGLCRDKNGNTYGGGTSGVCRDECSSSLIGTCRTSPSAQRCVACTYRPDIWWEQNYGSAAPSNSNVEAAVWIDDPSCACVCSGTTGCCDGCNYRPSTYQCRSTGSWTCAGGKCGQRRRENAANCPGTSVSCPTVTYGYDTINLGKVCSGGSEVDATSSTLACDSSYDYWATAGQCTYTKRYAECDGAGNCDTDASHNYHLSATLNVPSSKVAKTQSGGTTSTTYQDATSTVNTGTWENCNNAFCSANKRYYECDGDGTTSTTQYTQVGVTAQDGYTLTATCGTQGTTPCGSTLCVVDSCTGATYNDYPGYGTDTRGGCNRFCSAGICAVCSTTSGQCAPQSQTCGSSLNCQSAASNCGGGTVEKCRYSNTGSWEWVTSLGSETACSDGYDNDCDGNIDSADGDCCIPHGSPRTCSVDGDCCNSGDNYCSKNNPDGTQMSSSQWHCCAKGDEWWDPNYGANGGCVGTAGACGLTCSYDILANPQQYFNSIGNCVISSPKPYDQACCSVDLYGQTDKRYMGVTVY